jgi:hypothetical protein
MNRSLIVIVCFKIINTDWLKKSVALNKSDNKPYNSKKGTFHFKDHGHFSILEQDLVFFGQAFIDIRSDSQKKKEFCM